MARFITKTVCMALITMLCAGNVFAQGGTYNIITLANPAHAGAVFGGGTYHDQETATVTAIPDSCYKFVNWTENGEEVSFNPVYTFTVTGDRVLTANFEYGRQGYEITVLANPLQGGTVTGGGIYSCSEVATVKALPDSCCCYEFVNWTEDDIVVSTNAFYTFTVTKDRVLVANFALKTLDITLVADPPEGGEVFGGGSVTCLSTTTVWAIPNDCYEFLYWSEEGVLLSYTSFYTFVVFQNRTLVAHFAPKEYGIAIFADPPEGGTVVGDGIHSCASIDSICAFASPCYEFVNWTEDGEVVSTEMCYAFEVTEDRTLVANFAPKRDGCEVIVLANPPEGGDVTGGGGVYDCGEDVIICVTPNPCYEFLYWSEDGVALSTEACFTFTVTGNHTFVANFVLTAYEIVVLADPPEGGVVTGGGAYSCGEPVTVTATPAEGYVFVHWREDGVLVSDESVYTFTVTTSRTLVAEFSGTTAIGDVETSAINIYPNPTNGELKVESGELRVESVDVFDVYGRNVSRLTSHIAHPISIDISFLPSGVYFLRIQTETGVVVRKVVKE